MISRTSCGCTWQRVTKLIRDGVKISGDIVIVQCLKHASETKRAKRREKRLGVLK